MENLGRYLLLGSLLLAAFLGYQVITYFGLKMGVGVISFLFVGGVALSLVMSGNNSSEDDYLMDELLDDSSDFFLGKQGTHQKRDLF